MLDKSPWLDGFYERLIRIIKQCLEKVAGKAFLNYNELTILLTEIEQTLNTIPGTQLSGGKKRRRPPLCFFENQ